MRRTRSPPRKDCRRKVALMPDATHAMCRRDNSTKVGWFRSAAVRTWVRSTGRCGIRRAQTALASLPRRERRACKALPSLDVTANARRRRAPFPAKNVSKRKVGRSARARRGQAKRRKSRSGRPAESGISITSAKKSIRGNAARFLRLPVGRRDRRRQSAEQNRWHEPAVEFESRVGVVCAVGPATRTGEGRSRRRHVALSCRVTAGGSDAASRAFVQIDRENVWVSVAGRIASDRQAENKRPSRATPHSQSPNSRLLRGFQ